MKKIQLDMADERYARISALADKEYMSATAYCHRAVDRYMETGGFSSAGKPVADKPVKKSAAEAKVDTMMALINESADSKSLRADPRYAQLSSKMQDELWHRWCNTPKGRISYLRGRIERQLPMATGKFLTGKGEEMELHEISKKPLREEIAAWEAEIVAIERGEGLVPYEREKEFHELTEWVDIMRHPDYMELSEAEQDALYIKYNMPEV